MRNRIALAFLLASALPAAAHVTLAEPTAKSGSYYVAMFRVSHGCDGAPTTALSVSIPQGILIARPQPKAGWTIEKEHAPLSAPAKGEMGEAITQRVSKITWHGKLEADEFDQFGLLLKLPVMSGPLALPVVQSCEKCEADWTQTPAAGQDPHAMKFPAPVLTVTPAASTQDAMPGMKMP